MRSDNEKVALIERVTSDVEEGTIKDGKGVEAALEPLGAEVGPFGGASHEMDMALSRLKRATKEKGFAFF